MPRVTILLPVYESEKNLLETLESIKKQTYTDYELLVIYDKSKDNTLKILKECDISNLRIINGQGKGLANALNIGIENSYGEYIARIDADDLMIKERLEKQVNYMDSHKDVIICGGWQQYFGQSTFVHKPPGDKKQCRANLLFRCDLCHSTLMIRKSILVSNNLYYNELYAAEDFELWTRVLNFGEIANINEIIGFYRQDGNSITSEKKQILIKQNGQIVANTLQRNLNITLSDKQKVYFSGWINPFYNKSSAFYIERTKEGFEDLHSILLKIYRQNEIIGYYESSSLLKTLRAEWTRLRYNIPFILPDERIKNEYEIFKKLNPLQIMIIRLKSANENYRGFKRKYIKIKSIIKQKTSFVS